MYLCTCSSYDYSLAYLICQRFLFALAKEGPDVNECFRERRDDIGILLEKFPGSGTYFAKSKVDCSFFILTSRGY